MSGWNAPALAALLALLPLAAALWRGLEARPLIFWPAFAVALGGTAALLAVETRSGWPTGFADALWLSIGACLLAFGALSVASLSARKLGLTLMPLLIASAVLAAIWIGREPRVLPAGDATAWMLVHVGATLATYALVALAAGAGFATLVQERAIKRKRRGPLSARLPSVAACERLELRLLVAAAAVLGLGIAAGMAWSRARGQALIPVDHKSIFALAAFGIILAILALHRLSGLRGRAAARWVLAACVALILAYPGVKFVSEVLIGR